MRHELGGILKRFVLALGLALGLTLGLIVVMNPFGNLPVRALGPHVIMDTNDRFQFPAIVRSGNFDSGVFGTSSSKLLDPAWLERAFGGRFANLAFNDGRAWRSISSLFYFCAPCRGRGRCCSASTGCGAPPTPMSIASRGATFRRRSTTRTPGTTGAIS